MTVTLTDSHAENGSSPHTIDVSAELALGNTAGNLQVVTASHRTSPRVPFITDTSGGGDGDWIGPFENCAEVNASANRRSMWMWYRTVPSDAGDFTVDYGTDPDPSIVTVHEYNSTLSSGTWRLDSSPAGGVWENDRSDDNLAYAAGGSARYGQSGTSITAPTVQAGSEGLVHTVVTHRHGSPGYYTEHSCTGFTVETETASGVGSSQLSVGSAYKISTAAESPAWSWSSTTNHIVSAWAFSYDTATASSGTLSNPTVVTSGTSTTDIADGSSTITTASFTPVAGRLYLMAVYVHFTNDEDDFVLDVSDTTGLNWVLIGWWPDDGADSGWGIWRAQEPSGLSNGAVTFSYGDTAESVNRLHHVIIEIDGVDDTGYRGSAAVIQQDDPLDQFFQDTTGGSPFPTSTLTQTGDGHIAFFFNEGAAITGWTPGSGWTNLHERATATPTIEMRVDYDFTSPAATVSPTHTGGTGGNDKTSAIFAIKAAAAGGGATAPPPVRHPRTNTRANLIR